MQVGEERLPAPQPVVLLLDRLLDLEQQVGVGPHVVGAVDDPCARARCSPRRDRGALPGARSTSTSCPARTSSVTPAGVSATRYSRFLTSRGTPTRIADSWSWRAASPRVTGSPTASWVRPVGALLGRSLGTRPPWPSDASPTPRRRWPAAPRLGRSVSGASTARRAPRRRMQRCTPTPSIPRPAASGGRRRRHARLARRLGARGARGPRAPSWCWPSRAGRSRPSAGRSPGTWTPRPTPRTACPWSATSWPRRSARSPTPAARSPARASRRRTPSTPCDVLAVLLVVLPVGWLLLRWLPWRLRYAREAGAARRLLPGTPDLEILAARALATAPLPRLPPCRPGPAPPGAPATRRRPGPRRAGAGAARPAPARPVPGRR